MTLSQSFAKLKNVEEKLNKLSEEREKFRKEIKLQLEQSSLKNYEDTNGNARIDIRKNIVFSKPKEEVIEQIEIMELPFVETKKELTKDFEEQLKSGAISFDGINVEEKQVLFIKLK